MDLRIIKVVDLLPVLRVDLQNSYPLVLELTGEGYQHTAVVAVNGMDMPKRSAAEYGYTVVSPNTILVQPPPSMQEALISSILVFGDTANRVENASIEFELTSLSPARGLVAVVQQFLRLLLASPGSDLFEPTQGGGLGNIAGVVLTDENFAGLSTRALAAVKKCAADLRDSQLFANIPSSERLLDVIPINITIGTAGGGIDLQLEFQTETQRAITKVGV